MADEVKTRSQRRKTEWRTMTSKSTSKLASGAGPMLIGACLTFGMSLELTSGLAAEELRIGFIAPMTGPFAQVGKDMVNGFEMYTNEVKGDLGGATVKFILEDDQAKPPTGVLKAEKLIRQDKVHMLIGGVLASAEHCGREGSWHFRFASASRSAAASCDRVPPSRPLQNVQTARAVDEVDQAAVVVADVVALDARRPFGHRRHERCGLLRGVRIG